MPTKFWLVFCSNKNTQFLLKSKLYNLHSFRLKIKFSHLQSFHFFGLKNVVDSSLFTIMTNKQFLINCSIYTINVKFNHMQSFHFFVSKIVSTRLYKTMKNTIFVLNFRLFIPICFKRLTLSTNVIIFWLYSNGLYDSYDLNFTISQWTWDF